MLLNFIVDSTTLHIIIAAFTIGIAYTAAVTLANKK